LVLENELIDEGVLLEAVKGLLELLHVEVAWSVGENFQLRISFGLVVTEDVVAEGKVFVSELVGGETFVVLDLEVTMDWLGELNKGQGSFREHIWFGDSNCVILFIFLKAVHELLELNIVLLFE
jgi:hypothetical protein